MKTIILMLFLFPSLIINAQLSPFEKSAGLETATYFEAIEWYKALDKKSPIVAVKTMGATDAGYPLHLVMISSDGKFDPAKWHEQGKVVILINNGIHPGEPDGIDASMMMVRDIVNKKIQLPANVAIGLIPVYNIGGCLNRNSYTRANQNGPKEYGFRGNSQNLDLNRDFTKGDTKESRSFSEIFHHLNPDILVDNHVSDGADFQHTMTLISSQYDKLGPTLGNWVKNVFEPMLYKNMAEKGWDMIPYVDFGSTDLDKGMRMFMDPPRYSSGYAALFNTMAFMPETHMLKPFKERVQSTYDLMRTFIDQASIMSKEVKRIRSLSMAASLQQQTFPLKWIADSSRFSEITFKGYETEMASSVATGLNKTVYNHSKPFAKKIPFYHSFLPAAQITKPKAYVVPAGWHSVIELLNLNKVIYRTLSRDSSIDVTSYTISDYKTMPRAYEKHHKNYGVKVDSTKRSIKFLKGDVLVFLNQAANRYLVEMLEPTSEDGFFAWNFFDGILQQKEGYSDYRWEDIAAEVLKSDLKLSKMLEEKKRSDTKFAADSNAILAFIHKNSPYYEAAHMNYPVYRIEY